MTNDEKVAAMFTTAGVTPNETDLAFFTTAYPMMRMLADMLYTVDTAKYESPGLVFDPAPRFDDWG